MSSIKLEERPDYETFVDDTDDTVVFTTVENKKISRVKLSKGALLGYLHALVSTELVCRG